MHAADKLLRRIVILGGGTAGWMSAAPLARLLCGHAELQREVVVVESPEIATIGVGEATLPPIRFYNATTGIDEAAFVRGTQATFKLGIEFRDWGHAGHRFFHGFGDFGPPILGRSSFSHWLRLARQGDMPSHEAFSTPTVMARQGRFTPPSGERPGAANAYSYAYHFDAALYAAFLREHAMKHGARRVEGTVASVEQRPQDGFVTALVLRDGRRIEGELFIDCSGFRAVLIEGAMKSPFEDWSAWLPCDRALAVPCERHGELDPFTTATARGAGWQWRIPLQHRTGNGHVYCSAFTGDDEAAGVLLGHLDGKALDAPRALRFTTGRRRAAWVKNVVAIGLAAGFLEPLESTSIQLIVDGVGRLIELFPDLDVEPALADEYNRRMGRQYESIRDFIVLHYKLAARGDTEFWRHSAAMPVPATLQHQIELFRRCGRVAVLDPDGFAEPSWVSLLFGLGVMPASGDPFVDLVDESALRTHFVRLRQAIAGTVQAMPGHADYLARMLTAAREA